MANAQWYVNHKEGFLCYRHWLGKRSPFRSTTLGVQQHTHTPLDRMSDVSIVSQQGTATCIHQNLFVAKGVHGAHFHHPMPCRSIAADLLGWGNESSDSD